MKKILFIFVALLAFTSCDVEMTDDNGETYNCEFQVNVSEKNSDAEITGVVKRIARVPGGGYVYRLDYEGKQYLITAGGRCIIQIIDTNNENVENVVNNTTDETYEW